MKTNAPYINIHTHNVRENQLTITSWGIHPYNAESMEVPPLESIDLSVDSIGEIGLDFSVQVDRDTQLKVFEQQLDLAQSAQLPVVIHCVRAFEPIMRCLSSRQLPAVIFHGFIGSEHQAAQALDRTNYYLSFGHRCFSSPKTLKVLSSAPLDRIFFETDEHDIDIEQIYSKAAAYRTENLNEIKTQLYNNYINIFNRK